MYSINRLPDGWQAANSDRPVSAILVADAIADLQTCFVRVHRAPALPFPGCIAYRYTPPMLITDSFVMLNYPKTGTSFARQVIKELYAREPRRWFGRWCKELILPNIRTPGVADQHGTYSQLPRRYRNREIVAIIRNPYDRFLSVFEFRYWVNVPLLPWDVVYRRFPSFPSLTLDEYVDFDELVSQPFYQVPVGTQTAWPAPQKLIHVL
jgi:hypothetical protein